MRYIAAEDVAKAKEMDLLTCLRNYEPQELVHVSGNTYCTKEHDSLRISNGKWCWFSQGIGGRSALDYLIKVKGIPFTQAAEIILGREAEKPPVFYCQKERRHTELLMPELSETADRVGKYLQGRGIHSVIIRYCLDHKLLFESADYHNAVFVGYDKDGKLPENIRVVGCWAHARRKFDEALQTLPKEKRKDSLAAAGECYCSRLFQMEKSFVELTPEERYEKRLKLEKPVLDALLAWANEASGKTAPKSALGRALHYLLEQWPYLIRYLEDVQLELSNNRAERSIKPFVMGRKNWLFANTPGGAQSSSVICSLIETAKENGLDPYRYLLWVLRNAPAMSQTDEGLGRTTRACQCTPGMQNVKRMNISGLSYVSYARDAFLYAGRFDGYVTYPP